MVISWLIEQRNRKFNSHSEVGLNTGIPRARNIYEVFCLICELTPSTRENLWICFQFFFFFQRVEDALGGRDNFNPNFVSSAPSWTALFNHKVALLSHKWLFFLTRFQSSYQKSQSEPPSSISLSFSLGINIPHIPGKGALNRTTGFNSNSTLEWKHWIKPEIGGTLEILIFLSHPEISLKWFRSAKC